MIALSRRLARRPVMLGIWAVAYLGYTLNSILGGPAWISEDLSWVVLLGLAALVIAYAMRYAYRRGARAADDWYEPRLYEVREAVSELATSRPAEPAFLADQLRHAAGQHRRLRELNDRVQSVDFWGRSL